MMDKKLEEVERHDANAESGEKKHNFKVSLNVILCLVLTTGSATFFLSWSKNIIELMVFLFW